MVERPSVAHTRAVARAAFSPLLLAASACAGHDASDGAADAASSSTGQGEGSSAGAPDATSAAGGTTGAVDGPPTILSFTVNGSTAPAPVTMLGWLAIAADVTDDNELASVELWDGPERISVLEGPPFEFDALLGSKDSGVHTYRIHAIDDAGNTTDSDPIELTILLPDGGTTVWSEQLTVDASDETVAALVVASDDTIVVLGDRTAPASSTVALLRKLEPDGGAVLASWQHGGIGPSAGAALAISADDSLLAIGTETTSDADIWWQRLSGELEPQWSGGHDSGLGDDEGRAGELDGEGGAYVVGHVATADSGLRVWAARLGPEGEEQWVDNDSRSDSALRFAYGSAQDPTALVIAGARGAPDAAPWLRRVDVRGDAVWERPPPGRAEPGTIAYDVVLLPTGDAIVAGQVIDEGNDHAEVWIRRVDSAGETRWTNTIDPDSNTAFAGAFAAGITRGGEVAVVGYTTGATRDTWVGVVNPDTGALRWETARDLETGLDDEARAIGFDSIGRHVIGATVHAGSDRAWLLTLNP